MDFKGTVTNLHLEALNGQDFVGGQEGELLDFTIGRDYIIPLNLKTATDKFDPVVISEEMIVRFLVENTNHIISSGAITEGLAAVTVSYLRLLAIKNGLVSTEFKPAAYFVKYNETTRLKADTDTAQAGFVAGLKIVTDNLAKVNIPKLTSYFTDLVCLVAYVFRARGHHYLDSYEELYKRIFEKTRLDKTVVTCTFKDVATTAFHAIYPTILDEFWLQKVKKQEVNGALAKRIDVAPAGMAGLHVLWQGAQDLKIVFPRINAINEKAFEYLDQQIEEANKERYYGSVNAVYYGCKKVALNEKLVGPIAAILKSIMEQVDEDAPILKSNALTRIANNAPISGKLIGKKIVKFVEDKPLELKDEKAVVPALPGP
jgi:hypothetical protein